MISRDHMAGLLKEAFSGERAGDSYCGYRTSLFCKELFRIVR